MRARERARFGREFADCLGGFEVRHVHDQRIEAGPSLGLVNSGNGGAVGRVSGEAVNGLGRDRDWFAREDRRAASAIVSSLN